MKLICLKSQGNNPRISVVANDGHRTITPESDGHDAEIGGCLYGFRNVEGGIVVHLKYSNQHLSISIGHRDSELDQFFKCVSNVFVKLPEKV